MSRLDDIVEFCHFEEHDGKSSKFQDCEAVKAEAKQAIKELMLELIDEIKKGSYGEDAEFALSDLREEIKKL